MAKTLLAILPLLFVALAGCDKAPGQGPEPKPSQGAAIASPAAPAEVLEPAGWAAKPQDQWPQIVMTNDASFNGHTPLRGASSFLIRWSSGEILAATAQHLLGENGGVEPQVTLAQLDSSLKSWIMYPRTRPDRAVRILGSASISNPPALSDWVLLHVDTKSSKVQPLTLRKTPVKVGERVHLIGVTYAEPDVMQKVYTGTVTARARDRFRYDIAPHVDIRGFSGAPIVDDAGHLVGVMTVWFQPKLDGDLFTEAGGEDAAAALTIYKAAK